MLWIWLGFLALVLLFLALDLGVFHRHAHVVRIREALTWSAVWIALGLTFSVFVYHGYEQQWLGLGTAVDAVDGTINDGRAATIKYLTGYVIEKSLSVDNIFVFVMIFGMLRVPPIYQHRVLFWGILGALAMRGVMIGAGAEIIARYHWVLYVFGVFLILTALRMLRMGNGDEARMQRRLVAFVRRLVPVTEKFHGQHFLVRAGSGASHEPPVPGAAVESDPAVERTRAGVFMLTPLAITLILVEISDLIFAVDSIPAIFAITADPFLVFTSNVFAILGLRALYFALAGLMDKFRYLKVSLAVVLAVVGTKMLVAPWLKKVVGPNFNLYLLALVLAILTAGVLASILRKPDDPADAPVTDSAP